MTEQDQEARARASTGVALVVLGLLVLGLSGTCTGSVLGMTVGAPADDSYAIMFRFLALVIGGPVMLIGLGVFALGKRAQDPSFGRPPLWRRCVGLLVAAGGGLWISAYAYSFVSAVLSVSSREGAAENMADVPNPATGVLALLPWLVIPALMIWMGVVLIRRRRPPATHESRG